MSHWTFWKWKIKKKKKPLKNKTSNKLGKTQMVISVDNSRIMVGIVLMRDMILPNSKSVKLF